MKDKILKLRLEGKTYNEIKEQLGCSKGTIAYHCGEGQKEKYLKRQRRNRKKFSYYILRRISYFQKRCDKNRNYEKSRAMNFTVEDFLKKFGKLTTCSLTGIPIDLENDRNWDIDHIVPKSKGGNNSLENCQILLRDVNYMKNKLTEDQLFYYCKLILNYRKSTC